MLGAAFLAAAFVLSSPQIHAGGTIPQAQSWNRDGCDGGNVAPTLRWQGAPAGTKSFALLAVDPDALSGHGWYHWVVVDIPPQTSALEPGRVPPAAHEGTNDYGTLGYGGPCPPPGPEHHYVFTLYALTVPRLPKEARTGPTVEAAVRGHVLGTATLVGRFHR
jgi:Raf kinase inhibitor-like YbhB/YbcL family protein